MKTFMVACNTLGSHFDSFRKEVENTKGRIMFLQSSALEYHCVVLLGIQTDQSTKTLIGREAVIDSGPFVAWRVFRASTPAARLRLADEVAAYTAEYPHHDWAIADAALTSDDEFHCLTVVVGIKLPAKKDAK